MTKQQLAEAMAKDAGISKAAALKAIDSMTTNIKKSLKKGDHVSLIGFGRFSVKQMAARKGRNPQLEKNCRLKQEGL